MSGHLWSWGVTFFLTLIVCGAAYDLERMDLAPPPMAMLVIYALSALVIVELSFAIFLLLARWVWHSKVSARLWWLTILVAIAYGVGFHHFARRFVDLVSTDARFGTAIILGYFLGIPLAWAFVLGFLGKWLRPSSPPSAQPPGLPGRFT